MARPQQALYIHAYSIHTPYVHTYIHSFQSCTSFGIDQPPATSGTSIERAIVGPPPFLPLQAGAVRREGERPVRVEQPPTAGHVTFFMRGDCMLPDTEYSRLIVSMTLGRSPLTAWYSGFGGLRYHVCRAAHV
jgi:hypothetical protein